MKESFFCCKQLTIKITFILCLTLLFITSCKKESAEPTKESSFIALNEQADEATIPTNSTSDNEVFRLATSSIPCPGTWSSETTHLRMYFDDGTPDPSGYCYDAMEVESVLQIQGMAQNEIDALVATLFNSEDDIIPLEPSTLPDVIELQADGTPFPPGLDLGCFSAYIVNFNDFSATSPPPYYSFIFSCVNYIPESIHRSMIGGSKNQPINPIPCIFEYPSVYIGGPNEGYVLLDNFCTSEVMEVPYNLAVIQNSLDNLVPLIFSQLEANEIIGEIIGGTYSAREYWDLFRYIVVRQLPGTPQDSNPCWALRAVHGTFLNGSGADIQNSYYSIRGNSGYYCPEGPPDGSEG